MFFLKYKSAKVPQTMKYMINIVCLVLVSGDLLRLLAMLVSFHFSEALKLSATIFIAIHSSSFELHCFPFPECLHQDSPENVDGV